MAVRGARALSCFAFPVVLAVAACSGAGNADLFEGASEANDTSATDPTPSSTPPTAPSSIPEAGAPEPVPTPDAAAPDAAPEPPKCTPEAEPDNDLNHATTFTASFCGKIDAATDVDFGRFVVPNGAKGLAITHQEKNGKVSYRYYLNGNLLPVSGDSINAIPGAVYSVQIKLAAASNPGDRPSYQLDVSFK